MLRIEPLQIADHRSLIQLLDSEKPLSHLSDGFTHVLGEYSELVPQGRWAAFVDGEFAGCAGFVCAPTERQTAVCSIVIVPHLRRQTIATELSKHIVAAAEKHGVTRLLSDAFEQQEAGIQLLTKHGFNEVGRTFGYQLEVSTQASDPIAPLVADDVRIIALTQLPRRRLSDRLLPLWNCTRPDQPQQWPFAIYNARQFEQEILTQGEISLPNSFVMVSAIDEIVVMNLNIADADGNLFTAYSAVDPAFRGRGLAMALKAHLLTHARSEGIGLLSAETDKQNKPMRHINERIGYQHISTLITFQLEL